MEFVIHRLETCLSTNDVAREMARGGAAEGTVVVADEQTSGRGTKGRVWHSARGKGLYVSVVLRPRAASMALLPLAAGLAARDAVAAACGLEAGLRWPNDLVFGGRKLGGILCESAFMGNLPDYAVLGTGLNLSHAEGDFPPELRAEAVSIAAAAGRPLEREGLLAGLLAETARRAAMLERGAPGAEELLADFERCSAYRPGDRIAVRIGDETVRGAYWGLDPDGALVVVAAGGGARRFVAAEIAQVRI
jgi:BirA family transcriptional regulator, biotin operon repressor / biotin---[acetyl-CoA-carboxylase] ligase